MDLKRAREIAASPITKNVTHNGTPIYIESINNDNITAYVHPINQPAKRQRVDITNLTEQ